MSIDLDATPGDLAGVEVVDPTCLEGAESVEYLRACARVRNRATARFLTAVHEAGRAEDGTTTRRALVDEFSGDEVSTALGWSRAMAGRCLEFADDLHRRLVEVQAALASGELDEPKARVFSEWTRDLADDHAHRVCRELLPEAPGLPVGALIARLQQVAAALDPEWAARRERAAEKRVRVVASRNPSGTANVSGCDLPMTSGVAIMARVDALALLVRRGGVARRMSWIRGRVFERLLDGFAAGLTDDELVPLLIADLGALPGDDDGEPGPGGGSGPEPDGGPRGGGPGPRPGGGHGPDGGPDPDGSGQDDLGPDDSGPDDSGPDDRDGAGGPAEEREPARGDDSSDVLGDDAPRDDEACDHTPVDGPAEERAPDGRDPAGGGGAPASPDTDDQHPRGDEVITVPPPRPGAVREGLVEVRLRLSTALGLDDLPGEVPGWGTVLAGTARELLERHRHGEWRVVCTDDDGRLRRVLLPRRRPPGPRRSERRRGSGRTAIVELQAPTTLLAGLTPDDHGPWAELLRELQRRLAETRDGPPDATVEDERRRRPGAEADRWVRVRDRRCVAPGCRRPAHASDLDHTVDHARGGPSVSWNSGVWCRHHHRTKHEGGWRVTQPGPGRFHITTRAGARHVVTPPRITEPLPPPHPADEPRPLPAHELTDLIEDDTPLPPRDEPTAAAHRRAEALVDPPPPF